MRFFRFSWILWSSVIVVAPSAYAQTGNDSLADRQGEVTYVEPQRRLSTTYHLAERKSGDKDVTNNGATLVYAREFPIMGFKEFWFVSGSHGDFDSALRSTDNDIGTIGYGQSRKFGEGFFVTLSALGSKSRTDMQSTAGYIDSYTGALSLGLRQTFPIYDKFFGAVHASVTPSYNRDEETGNHRNRLNVPATTGAGLYYAVNEKLFLGANVQATVSNRPVTISSEDYLYSSGLGALYKMGDYSASLEYRRELIANQRGNLFNFTISRTF